MSDTTLENDLNNQTIERLEYLERRIGQLETLLGVRKISQEEFKAHETDIVDEKFTNTISNEESEEAMESKFGEVGLGWLGSIVLLFGIAFISQFIHNSGQPLFAAIFGYVAAAIVFSISYYIRKTITGLSAVFNVISYILLFYVTLRLHFFTGNPLVSEPFIPLILLIIISAVQFFKADRKNSEFLAIISFILLIVTANISNTTHFMLSLVTAGVLLSVYLLHKNSWWRFVIIAQILSYLSFIVWYIINVRTDNMVQKVLTDHNSIAYLFICVSAFSMITLFKKRDSIPEAFIFSTITLNGLFFTALLTMYMISFYMANYVGIFTSIFVICILFSVLLKNYSEWKYTPAFYSLYGFVSLSTAIFGIFGLPLTYLLLTIQSLLVLSMAIWFRSKIIVFMNFFLYVLLVIAYFSSSEPVHTINFTFAVVAIISARVINLQRHRLDVKTDLLRNSYLIFGFFIMLYALYKVVPLQYVTLSWTIAAVAYFILSMLIRNIKYRWMAIFSMVAAAIYLFIVDLASVGIIYRIVAFMFLALISIGLSVYYTKNKKKPTVVEPESEITE